MVCSSGRMPDESGKCPKTVANVDLKSCLRTGDEGADSLEATFTDPGFSSDVPSFYYARVFENPTCRWTTLLANSADSDLPGDVPETVQERGWSSPIWSASR